MCIRDRVIGSEVLNDRSLLKISSPRKSFIEFNNTSSLSKSLKASHLLSTEGIISFMDSSRAVSYTHLTPKEVYDISDIIMKVKEPLPPEYDLFKEGQTIFTLSLIHI